MTSPGRRHDQARRAVPRMMTSSPLRRERLNRWISGCSLVPCFSTQRLLESAGPAAGDCAEATGGAERAGLAMVGAAAAATGLAAGGGDGTVASAIGVPAGRASGGAARTME